MAVAESLPDQARRRRTWEHSQHRMFWLCLTPSLVVLLIVTLAPFAYLLATSATALDLTKPDSLHFVGAENYLQLLRDARFFNSVGVQARLSFWTVSLQLLLGLGLAMILNMPMRLIGLIRGSFIIPMVIPPIVVAIVWKILFSPGISPFYWVFERVGLPQRSWLNDPTLALWAIIVGETWEWLPFTMLVVLAALQMLPVEPLEAARIDGANSWQSFWYVVLPLLRPAIVLAGLFRFIDSVKAFPLIFIMTNGGPGTVTEPTNFYAYLQAFSYTIIGYSSAIVVVMLAITFVISFVVIRGIGAATDVE